MFRLIVLGLKYNLSAHVANLPNLIAATIGMLLNNIIFLIGIWGMLFAGKANNQPFQFYFLSLVAMIMTAWGGINFFFGGWIDLGEIIVNGHFESKLATPRHPLLLVAIHNLHPSALGDFLMGLFGIILLFVLGQTGMAIRTAIGSVISLIGLFALYIFSGSLAFFIPRGNVVATLIREVTISLSSYPVGKVFPSGLGRIILLLTPAAAVSVLPLQWIENFGPADFLYAILAVGVFLLLAIVIFQKGLVRYQSLNLIGAQS